MWKWDFCMFLQGTSSGSEVHKIVIEVGEYQCVALRATWCQAICRWSWSTLWISSHCPFVPGPFSFYASHLLPSSHLCLSGFEHGKLAPAVASLQHATWWMTDHQVSKMLAEKHRGAAGSTMILLSLFQCFLEGNPVIRDARSMDSAEVSISSQVCKEVSHVLWKLPQARMMEKPKYFLGLFSFLASLLTFKPAFLCFARGLGAPGPHASQQLAKVQAKTSIQE